MLKFTLALLSLSAAFSLGSGPSRADDAPGSATGAAAVAASSGGFDTRIDTWVEGVILKLDLESPKFAVGGHKMPYASIHAEMLKEMAAKTAGMDAAKTAATETEVRTAWADKLKKASAEDHAKDKEFTLKMPEKGELVVLPEDAARDLDFLHHEKADDQSVATSNASVRNDQKAGQSEVARTTDQKQMVALGALSQVNVGDSVSVGFASGLVSNEAFVIIKHKTLSGAR